MIDRFETALITLLKRELAATRTEVESVRSFRDVEFTLEQPKQEFSTSWSKSTNGVVNLFLHDLRENNRLRGQNPMWNVERKENQATMQRRLFNFDLHYMLTAWAARPEDEHGLLMALLMALLRNEGIPDDLMRAHLAELQDGVSFKVAQYDTQINPRDIWSVLDNQMRPGIDLIVTIPINPFHYYTSPLVREVETTFHDLNRRRT